MSPHGEGRRYHEANAGRDSKPVIFIFEGNNILWMVLGCVLALLVFRLGHDHFHWSLGESLAAALDINDRRTACGFIDVQLHDLPNKVPCAWRLADATDPPLILLPLPTDAVNAAAVAINNAGTIVGYYEPADLRSRACVWEETESGFEFKNLETFGVARGINNFGQIVGGSDRTSYLWQDGERHDIAEIKGGPERSRVLGILFTGELILRDSHQRATILQPRTALNW